MRCTLNSYKAPVKWYKDNKELDAEEYIQDKNIMGVCTLKIIDPVKEDAGKFSCKIVGKVRHVGEEKKENCVTKTKLVVQGT